MMKNNEKKYIIALIIIAAAFISVSISIKYVGLNVQDAYDYAQLARNTSKGNYFESSIVIPVAAKIQQPNNIDVWRPPLYPTFISIFFSLFGSSETVSLIASVIAYFLFITCIYCLGKKMYCVKTGFLAALLTACLPEICWYTINCLREPIFCALLAAGIYVLYKPKNPYLIGVLGGLSYLTRYNTIFLLAPFTLYLMCKKKNKKFLLKVIICFFATISPWCIRNTYNNLSPFFTLQRHEVALFTPSYPHYTIYRHTDPIEPIQFAVGHSNEIFDKGWHYSFLHYWPQTIGIPPLHTKRVSTFFSPKWWKEKKTLDVEYNWANFIQVNNRQFSLYSLIFIILAGLLIFNIRGPNSLFYRILMAGIFLQFLALSFIHPVARHYIPFLVICIVFVVGEWLVHIKNIFFVLFLFIFLGSITLLYTPQPSWKQKSDFGSLFEFIRKNTPQDAYIATNAPFEIAWKTNRKTLWLPVYLDDFKKLEQEFQYFCYHPRGKNDWLHTTDALKEYLKNNYTYIYEHKQGAYFFIKKEHKNE